MNLFRALALASLCTLSVWMPPRLGAQNAALMPVPKMQFFDGSGIPLAGGYIYTYAAGTTTPLATYTDATANTPNSNPVVLDAGGFASIWLGSSAYKIVAENSAGVTIWTQDNVSVGSLSIPGMFKSATGSTLVGYQASGTSTTRTVAARLGDSISVLDYGAKGDGTTDDTAAIRSAISACGAGGILLFPQTGANAYVISSTLTIPAGCQLKAEGGAGPTGSGSNIAGEQLKWAGATNTEMLWFHDVAHAGLDGLSLNCNNVSGCIAILYDSDDNPPSSFNTFQNFTIAGSHMGLVVGLTSTAFPGFTQCANTPLQPGCYEADFFQLKNFNIFGNCSDVTAEGIHINSSNGGQSSLIDGGNIQCVNIGVHIVSSNGFLDIDRINGGSPVGSSPAFLQFDATVAISPNLWNDETEGGWAYSVHDSSCNPGFSGNPIWIANGWYSGTALIDGCETVTSMASKWSSNAFQVSGTSIVTSLNEQAHWQPTGSQVTQVIANGTFSGQYFLANQYVGAGLKPTSGVQNGDLFSSRSATGGVLWFGSDSTSWISRQTDGSIYSPKGWDALTGAGFRTGQSGNTDNAGIINFPGGTSSQSYTFQNSYANPPICTATPTGNPGSGLNWWATVTTTTLTIGTSANTATPFAYTCFPRN